MNRAVGIDISKWQGYYDPGKATRKSDFVIQRAYYGIWEDTAFYHLLPGVMEGTAIRGAYHYLRSDFHWELQADLYLQLVTKHDFHFHVCDLETGYNVMSRTFVAMAMEWCKKVQQETGKKVVFYTNRSTYDTWVNKYDPYRAKQYPFWIAQYPWVFPDAQVANPMLPASRQDWAMWQYSDKNLLGHAHGVGSWAVDMNVFNGTFEEMGTFFNVPGIGVPQEPEPEPDPEPEPPIIIEPTTLPVDVVITNSAGLNVRNAPGLSATVVGWNRPYHTLTVSQILKDKDENIWGKISDGYACLLLKSSGRYFTSLTKLDGYKIDDVPEEVRMFFRLRHDKENPRWDKQARQMHPEWTHSKKVGYPQTFPILGGNGIVNLDARWMRFVKQINSVKAYEFHQKPDSGWFNKGTCNDTFCQVRQLSWGGNVVEVSHIVGDRAYLANYYYLTDAPPDTTKAFYDSNIIHHFSVVYPDGYVEGPPCGLFRTFIIARDRSEKLYVPTNQIIRVPGPSVYFP